MRQVLRKVLPAALLILAAAGIAATIRSTRLPKADFTFVNGTEIKSVDPHAVTGQPEGRIVHALYEGLVNWHPQSLEPTPGVAERWEISPDGRTYTFHLRDEALWSDGSQVTAEDFVYSFRRLLDPETAAEYASQLWYLKNGKRYSLGDAALEVGAPVEIELHEKPEGALPFARGRVERGKLKLIVPAPRDGQSSSSSDSSGNKSGEASAPTLGGRVFVVEIAGSERRFRETESPTDHVAADETPCRRMLFDFREVGVEAADSHTLRVTLENPTPYFLGLTGFYPLFPVQQKCLETHGEPNWTRPENLVTNGAYRLSFRRVRDVIRLSKSATYWNRAHVALETVDALAIESQTTALSLYLKGEVDWLPGVPPTVVGRLLREQRDDLYTGTLFATSFFRCNTLRPPLDDPRVRKALAWSIDREEIIRTILQANETPAYSLVPSGTDGYPAEPTFAFDVAGARKLLAEAGYPSGQGFPRISLLYNESEGNAAIAQLLQAQWRRNLGIELALSQEEWSSFLARARRGDYSLVRGGWIGDYRDPNTFLELFLTGVPNNQTGWGNSEYDEHLAAAARAAAPEERWRHFRAAEKILADEMPILPVSFYVSKNLVQPYVRGFFPNAMDVHPLESLSIDPARKADGEGRR